MASKLNSNFFKKASVTASLLTLSLLVNPAHAVNWQEVGDAGQLLGTAQEPLGNGPLDLPVAADRLVEIVLDGATTLPVTFLLTPRTTSRQSKLNDGQPVTIAVVTARRVVVAIEATQPR